MTDIGSQLRAAREAKGLTLEQAFKATRIKLSFLEAIEANQFDALPGPVQARGFVRSYANYLGLDGEHLASLLDAHKAPLTELRPVSLSAVPTKPQTAPLPHKLPPPSPRPVINPVSKPSSTPEKPAEAARPPLRTPTFTPNPAKSAAKPAASGIPTWVLIVGAALLFVMGAALVISALTSAGQSPQPDAPSNVPDSVGGAFIPERLAPASAQSEPVSITVTALEHAWARITIDGQTAFEGMLEPKSGQVWQAAEEVIVETGNAAALRVGHQGQETVLGERGQIVARAWRRSGAADVPLAMSGEFAPQATVVATNTTQ